MTGTTVTNATASDLMTLDEAAVYLHFKTVSGVLRWLKQHDVRRYQRGRLLLVRRSAIDVALERDSVGGLEDAAREQIARTPSLRAVR